MSYYDDDGLSPKNAQTYDAGTGGNNVSPATGGSLPGSRGGLNGSRGFDPNQRALVDLAKSAQRTGVTPNQSATLNQWANEYNIPFRGPEVHPGRPQGQYPHIHVGPVDHIKIKGDCP